MTEITIPSSVEEIGYSAFGYEADMKTAVKNFVIYGQSGSAAQRYASDSDDTYGYKNSFSFVTVQDASKVRGGRDSEDLSDSEEISGTTEAAASTDSESKKSGFNSKYLLLGISGLVLVIGAILVILGLRSGKKTEPESTESDSDSESNSDSDSDATPSEEDSTEKQDEQTEDAE